MSGDKDDHQSQLGSSLSWISRLSRISGYQDTETFTELLEEHPACHVVQIFFSISSAHHFLAEQEERVERYDERIEESQEQHPGCAGFLFHHPQQGIEKDEELRQQVEN